MSPDSKEAQAFRRGLLSAGYTEGRDVIVDWRWANGDYAPLPRRAAELVGLGLTNDHRSDLGGLAEDQGVAETLEEVVEPQRVPGAFDAHGDGPRQVRVELFNGSAAVDELPLKELAAAGIERGHLLLPRMQIAPHQDHEFGLLSIDAAALGSAETTNSVRPFS